MTRARPKNKSRAVSTRRRNLAYEWLRCFTEAIPFARSGWQRVLLRLLLGRKNRLHKCVDPKFRQAGHSGIGTSARHRWSRTCPVESAVTNYLLFWRPDILAFILQQLYCPGALPVVMPSRRNSTANSLRNTALFLGLALFAGSAIHTAAQTTRSESSPWISPGLFGSGFQNVTAFSHETSEACNDPFGDTPVPIWQFPGQPPTSKVCQGNLETGDPLEVLPNATVGIFLKDKNQTFLYHPQTEALLQCFEMGKTSDAMAARSAIPPPPRSPSRRSLVPNSSVQHSLS
jgi:hypothetical protein